MATSKIVGTTKKATGMNIINTIRATIVNAGDTTYADRIPKATQDNLKDVGKALLNYQPGMNQFLNELINRIGLTVIKGRSYKNKLAVFKRGMLEYGDTIQEIYADIIEAKHYEPNVPDENPGSVFAQEKPNVYEAFHSVNREDYYKVTINEAMLKRAFSSYNNFDMFVAKIFNSLYNSDELDEYLLFTHLLGQVAKNSYQVQVTMPTDRATADAYSIQMRSYGLALEYMTRKYNQMGVANHTPLANQILILRSDIVPVIDVLQLANNFNLSFGKELSGRVIVIDQFGEGNDDITGMIVDEDFSMIYDTRYETTSIYNPQYLYWNYFLHHHQIISSSPFANAVAFVTSKPSDEITGLVLIPDKAEVTKGTSEQFNAQLSYTGTVDTAVTWEVKTSEDGEVNGDTNIENGLLKVDKNSTDTALKVIATASNSTTKAEAIVTLLPAEE